MQQFDIPGFTVWANQSKLNYNLTNSYAEVIILPIEMTYFLIKIGSTLNYKDFDSSNRSIKSSLSGIRRLKKVQNTFFIALL